MSIDRSQVGYTDYPNADSSTPKFVPEEQSREQILDEKVEILHQSFEALKRDYEKLKSKL